MQTIELKDEDDKQLMREVLSIVMGVMSQGGISKEDKQKIEKWYKVANS